MFARVVWIAVTILAAGSVARGGVILSAGEAPAIHSTAAMFVPPAVAPEPDPSSTVKDGFDQGTPGESAGGGGSPSIPTMAIEVTPPDWRPPRDPAVWLARSGDRDARPPWRSIPLRPA